MFCFLSHSQGLKKFWSGFSGLGKFFVGTHASFKSKANAICTFPETNRRASDGFQSRGCARLLTHKARA